MELDLIRLNDELTILLANMGWHPESEQDYARLNDLTHDVFALISDVVGA